MVIESRQYTPHTSRTCWVISQTCAACHGKMATDGFARWCMNDKCPQPPEGGYTE
jgi:hypothetical protein